MDTLLIVLRLIHILCGVLWAGWTFSLALFIEPAGRAAGPAGGTFMQALAGKTKLITVMTIAPVLAILSGMWLLWIVSSEFDPVFVGSFHGQFLLTGSILGLSVFVYGLLMIRPLAQRMGTIGAAIAASGGLPSETHLTQLAATRAQMRTRGMVATVMLAVCVAIMAVERFVW